MRKPDDVGLNNHKPTQAQHCNSNLPNAFDLELGPSDGAIKKNGQANGGVVVDGELYADGAEEPDGICGSEVSDYLLSGRLASLLRKSCLFLGDNVRHVS